MDFVDTTLKADEIAVGSGRPVDIGERQIGIFRQPDGLCAIDNVCPHRGALLTDGFVTDGYVTCPWHQWQFQLGDGVCRNIPNLRLASFPLEIRDGTIWIQTEGVSA